MNTSSDCLKQYLLSEMAQSVADARPMAPSQIAISDDEYLLFKKLTEDIVGIHLSQAKIPLLVGRLLPRLKVLKLGSFRQYFIHVIADRNKDELQLMVDLLTTNETFFFREPKHFDFLMEQASLCRGSPYQVWSAASSSGEEPYSMAMVLNEVLGSAAWGVVGSDISTRVLEKARRGHYSLDRTSGIPPAYLKKYCLQGRNEQAGTLLVTKEIRNKVKFRQCNLLTPSSDMGTFDVIFLRNVMIYFSADTKRRVAANLRPFLKSGGFLVVGHSETLHGLTEELVPVRPTIYQRRD